MCKYSINIFLCMDIHLTGLICHLFEILSKILIKIRFWAKIGQYIIERQLNAQPVMAEGKKE